MAKQRVPNKRSQQGELMFEEIFVKPKQMELEQFKIDKKNEVELLLGNKKTAERILRDQEEQQKV